MIFFIYEKERIALTFLCKVSASVAKSVKTSWSISILDWLLRKRSVVLGKESVHCMNKVKKWQRKAGQCIAAYHQYEMECKK